MYLHSMEPDAVRRARLADIGERVLHRLGDSARAVWSYEEIESYILRGGRELADGVKLVWDQVFLECLPAGFSSTADWEVDYETFHYGTASYTMEDEYEYLIDLMEQDDATRANHTNPSELHFLVALPASTAQAATAQLPETLTDIERVTYDRSTIVATNHRRMGRHDGRYQHTAGEVVAYTHEREGFDVLRKIRVPNAVAEIVTVQGHWGIMRESSDLTADPTSGTWGVARRVSGHHPMGNTEGWGLPRRFYLEGNNLKVEFWRQPRVEMLSSELPSRYYLYLVDYAQWQALKRNGPGQDYKLAELYKQKWVRGLSRIKSRVERKSKERMSRMGGDGGAGRGGPPRARLPWQYGSVLR